MRCRHCRLELGTSLRAGEGTLDPAVARHLGECSECDQLAQEMRATSRAVGSLEAIAVPEGFRSRMRARLTEAAREPRRHDWRESWALPGLQPRQAVVAGAVLAVAIVVLAIAMHGLLPAAGVLDSGPTMTAVPASPDGGAMAVGFQSVPLAQRMLMQHQTHEIAYPLRRDAGINMVSGE